MARITATMGRRKPYKLVYARGVTKHLEFIDAKYDTLIQELLAWEAGKEAGWEDMDEYNHNPWRRAIS